MQDYLIVKGQIDLIEQVTAPTGSKLEKWNRLDRIARATIRMHLSKSVYYTIQSCATANQLWHTFFGHIREKGDWYEDKFDPTLYILWMKEFNSVTTYLNNNVWKHHITNVFPRHEDPWRWVVCLHSRKPLWLLFAMHQWRTWPMPLLWDQYFPEMP